MVEAASLGLAGALTQNEQDEGLVYPRIERIRQISRDIAVSLIRAAQKEGVDQQPKLRELSDGDLKSWVGSKMWNA
jgi:malate dehydrogenase (oxaloacetate-decarboxylating)(NADP+)